jgi:hypothetical protein
LLILPNVPPLIFTAGIQQGKTVLMLYIPSDGITIATLTLLHVNSTMTIESVIISPVVCENGPIGNLLVQQIIAEARSLDVCMIINIGGQAVQPIAKEAHPLSELLGISPLVSASAI